MKREHTLLLVGIAIKTAIVWGAVALLTHIIPYEGNFPYGEILNEYAPSFLRPLANFDGLHYILIARMGYSQYEQAFFPLFPSLIHIVASLLQRNYLLAGILIANISFILGVLLLYATSKHLLEKGNRFWFISLYLSFPTAFFFNTLYTESVFLLFVTLALLLLIKQHYAVVAALLGASLTRLTGVFLFFPAVLIATQHKQKRWLSIISVSAPLIGLLLYMAYLWYTTGDPLYFFTAQPAFGANRSTNLILLPQVYYRYLRILTTADLSVAYGVAVIEVTLFTIMFVAVCLEGWYLFQKNRYQKLPLQTGILLFSLATLILPTLTGTFSSVPRYCLFSISSFLYLARIQSVGVKIVLCVIFAFAQLLLATMFIQGYFVS
ncbi:hypothetical protein COU89_02455 [Candidatus Roizmanbacteria bacterium CG10_big_fil_rev_8_21_14_0_10_45_7]|uniref:Glycosyltransferase RgtA/B/C/D-like domain-containing protein n=1 Tax=Candidatus Roizmanbacteria bacterium CG10_big_fil_rev_8_21_14_0_10_45_7 TaxID=1974854 RepID=A0A2M8KUP7_9BACT|nr:MAG: hypothetical protein COU89_02455 [Candidatus Roizmanbacteria bacterium CG10_big_fil_rev_8_21_14_0_10_45_7]